MVNLEAKAENVAVNLSHSISHFSADLSVSALGLAAFLRCLHSPPVLRTATKCIKPISVIIVVLALLGFCLLVPMQMLALLLEALTFGRLGRTDTLSILRRYSYDALTLVPTLSMLALRSAIRKPLNAVFARELRQVSPPLAAEFEAGRYAGAGGPRGQRAQRGQHSNQWFLHGAGWRNRILQLLIWDVCLSLWYYLPLIGRLAGPVTLYRTLTYSLAPKQAGLLCLLGLWKPASKAVLWTVRSYETSRVLGSEALGEWAERCVAAGERDAFFRQEGRRIAFFYLPQTLAMQIPIIGPLFFVVLQATAAHLLSHLSGAPGGPPGPNPNGAAQGPGAPVGPGPAAATLPEGPIPQGPTPQGLTPQWPGPEGPRPRRTVTPSFD